MEYWYYNIFFIWIISHSHNEVIGYDDTEINLVDDLLRNYDPRIRPSSKPGVPLNVTFGLALAQIIDLDEKNQIITTNCWLNQAWIDFRLQWNVSHYNNVSVLRMPYDTIWRPDILLYNNADMSAYVSSISTNVIVSSNGNITWLSMVIFKSSCAIDVKYFPFDEQNCTLQFASWTYDGFQLNLIKVGEDGDVSNFISNSEWTLMKLHATRNVVYYSCCDEPYPDVTYAIQIRRKPLFYVFNMIMPCILINLVALLGFYIPSDSGEKVTIGITTLLSMTVFLMLVAEAMPPTSEVLPLLGIYYGITIAVVSLATGMTVFTLRIHYKGQHGIECPFIIKRIFLDFFGAILFLQFERDSKSLTAEEEKSYKSNKPKKKNKSNKMASSRFAGSRVQSSAQTMFEPCSEDNMLPSNGTIGAEFREAYKLDKTLNVSNELEYRLLNLIDKIYESIEKYDARMEMKEKNDHVTKEWQQVALVLDRILLILFLGVTIGTILLFAQSPHFSSFISGQTATGIGQTSEVL